TTLFRSYMAVRLGGRDHRRQQVARKRLLLFFAHRVEGRLLWRLQHFDRRAGAAGAISRLPIAISLVGERSDDGHSAELQSGTAEFPPLLGAEQDTGEAARERTASETARQTTAKAARTEFASHVAEPGQIESLSRPAGRALSTSPEKLIEKSFGIENPPGLRAGCRP